MSKAKQENKKEQTVAVYVRVSREDRRAHEKNKKQEPTSEKEQEQEKTKASVEQQRADGIALANKLGYGQVKIYEDRNLSGSLPPRQVAPKARKIRPGLTELITDAQEGKIHAIIARKSDRISRGKLAVAISIYQLLQDLNINIHFSHDPMTMGKDASDELLFNLLLTFNNYELRKYSQNARDVKNYQREHGLKYHPVIAFGFDNIDKQVMVNDTEAEIIRQMVEWLKNGEALSSIAKKLNDLKIKPKRGGKEFLLSTVKSILSNPNLAGLKGDTRVDWIPQILTEQEFYQLQSLLAKRSRKAHKTNHQHALTGIIKCGYCGSPLCLMRSGSKGDKLHYRCQSRYYAPKSHSESPKTLYLAQYEWLFEHFIKEAILDREEIDFVATGKVSSLERKRTELKKLMLADTISVSEFGDLIKDLNDKISKLKAAKGGKKEKKLPSNFNDLPVVEQRLAIGEVVESIQTYSDGVLLTYTSKARVVGVTDGTLQAIWCPIIKRGHKSISTLMPTGLVGLVEYLGIHGLGSVWGIDHESLEGHQQAG